MLAATALFTVLVAAWGSAALGRAGAWLRTLAEPRRNSTAGPPASSA